MRQVSGYTGYSETCFAQFLSTGWSYILQIFGDFCWRPRSFRRYQIWIGVVNPLMNCQVLERQNHHKPPGQMSQPMFQPFSRRIYHHQNLKFHIPGQQYTSVVLNHGHKVNIPKGIFPNLYHEMPNFQIDYTSLSFPYMCNIYFEGPKVSTKPSINAYHWVCHNFPSGYGKRKDKKIREQFFNQHLPFVNNKTFINDGNQTCNTRYETLNYFVNYFNYLTHDLISIETGEKESLLW